MSWIIPIAGVFNFILGLIVFIRKPKDPLNYSFFLFVINTVISISLDFIFRFYPTLFILRFAYAFAIFIPLSLLYFILQLCGIDITKIPFWKKIFFFIPTGLIFILCYVNGYIVQDIYELTVLGYRGQLGPLFIVYSLYYLVYLIIIAVLLYKKYVSSREHTERTQILFASTGVILYGISAILFSLILPTYFKIFNYTLLDSPSLFFFVSLMSYAILKLKLFNIKVIATELITFILWIFISVRAILSDTLRDQLINWGMLIVVVIVGILLIQSVIKEVQLREKIEKLAKDLENANDRLKDLDQLKSEFLSLATHQIRAPLTAIRGYASNILEGDYGEVPLKIRGAIQIISTSCQNLVVIVGEFLDISRIEQGRMKYDLVDFDATALVQEIITELKPTIDKTGLSMNLESSSYICMAHGDTGKIKQVINNIIDNSVKYTKKGGVTISLSADKEFITIKISDTGIGIAADDIPKLFTKFTRAKDAFRTNVIGTGLGLYIAKQMVEAQGGKIWVESEGLGRGSSFFIKLPKTLKLEVK